MTLEEKWPFGKLVTVNLWDVHGSHIRIPGRVVNREVRPDPGVRSMVWVKVEFLPYDSGNKHWFWHGDVEDAPVNVIPYPPGTEPRASLFKD